MIPIKKIISFKTQIINLLFKKRQKQMADFKINSINNVSTIVSRFKKEFGGGLKIYDGRKIASGDTKIGDLAKGSIARGSEVSANGNLLVRTFEQRVKEVYGLRVNVTYASGRNADDNTKLADLND